MRTKTILIIDDDARSRDVLRDILEEDGFAVIALADAADAFSQPSQHVDLVLLDLVMPLAAMDGFTFLATAHARTELVDTPVIVLSGLGDSILEALDPATSTTLRIAAVVRKPVDMAGLLSVVRGVLYVGDPP